MNSIYQPLVARFHGEIGDPELRNTRNVRNGTSSYASYGVTCGCMGGCLSHGGTEARRGSGMNLEIFLIRNVPQVSATSVHGDPASQDYAGTSPA